FLFFFSSRRRHTRWPRDWSSDVCSSDLFDALGGGEAVIRVSAASMVGIFGVRTRITASPPPRASNLPNAYRAPRRSRRRRSPYRSEERRVGKAGRSRKMGGEEQ